MVSAINWCFLYLFINAGIQDSLANLDWWQTSVIYQIYPRSFKDSNGDGNGDLKGIEEQMDYFRQTGIQSIWLSPIFRSPMVDGGYDVSNFTDIDPLFGTMDDFFSLVKSLKSMNTTILLDFVPNHTSNESEWFQKSIEKIEPYTDYYIWRDPKGWTDNGRTPIPPNNWISVFSGSAWQYQPDRKQFYLHQFLAQQPDLNYRSRAVVEEMKVIVPYMLHFYLNDVLTNSVSVNSWFLDNVLRFWLDKGVDGFRVDSASYLIEDAHLRDEPVISNETVNGVLKYDSLDHIYTTFLPETYDIIAQFRAVLDSYSRKDGHTRVLLTEAYPPPSGNLTNVTKFYGNSTNPAAQIPFNFLLLKQLNSTSNASTFNTTVNIWLDNMPAGQWPNWVMGNHDNERIASRFTHEMIDGINMLLLLLPGTAISYNGDELGMENARIRWDQTVDTFGLVLGPELYTDASRDPERTPFQWDSSLNAGFSNCTARTWLPVHPNYYYLNFEAQKHDTRSSWKVYRDLISLRMKDAFLYGNLSTYVVSEWIFAFTRTKSDDEIYVVVLNLNNEYENVNLSSAIPNLPTVLEVQLASVNSEYDVGTRLNSGRYAPANNTDSSSSSSEDSAAIPDGYQNPEFVDAVYQNEQSKMYGNSVNGTQQNVSGNSTGTGVTFTMRPQSALVLRSSTGKEPDIPTSGSSTIHLYPTIIFMCAVVSFNFYLR